MPVQVPVLLWLAASQLVVVVVLVGLVLVCQHVVVVVLAGLAVAQHELSRSPYPCLLPIPTMDLCQGLAMHRLL